MRSDKDEIARLKLEVKTLQQNIYGAGKVGESQPSALGLLIIENQQLKEMISQLKNRLIAAEANNR